MTAKDKLSSLLTQQSLLFLHSKWDTNKQKIISNIVSPRFVHYINNLFLCRGNVHLTQLLLDGSAAFFGDQKIIVKNVIKKSKHSSWSRGERQSENYYKMYGKMIRKTKKLPDSSDEQEKFNYHLRNKKCLVVFHPSHFFFRCPMLGNLVFSHFISLSLKIVVT